MRIGLTLPQLGEHTGRPDEVARFAQTAEDMGVASLWVGDRLLAPVDPTVGYAGTDSIPDYFRSVLDPFAVLTVAATVTSRVQLGTNVLNAPWYSPALLARSLTSIDVLSGGRLLPGFGIGWSPEEYQAVNVPMTERGSRLDEILDVIDTYWTENPVAHTGKHWTIPASHVNLKPARKPPIYLAGYADAALKRIAQRADGWLPVMTPPRPLEDTLTNPLAKLRELTDRPLDIILRVNPIPGTTVTEIADSLKLAEDTAGVQHAFIDAKHLPTIDDILKLASTLLP